MRRLLIRLIPLAATIAAIASACDTTPTVPPLPSTGVAVGIAFLDRNGNGTWDANTDTRAPNVKVSLVVPGGSEVAQATTDLNGLYVMRDVQVGRYQVKVDSASVGDTLRILKIDSAAVTVGVRDTALTYIVLGFPTAKIADVRKLPIGRKVQVEGIALNAWVAFGDSTISLTDGSSTIRALRVRPNVSSLAGDSLRMVGTVAMFNGQVVLTSVDATVLSSGAAPPAARTLTTAAAATANNGALDASLVQVRNASILSVRSNLDGDLVASVNDGSGPVDVTVPSHSGGITQLNNFTAGALLDATGILVPVAGGGGWTLRPRINADIKTSFRTVTIAQARNEAIGKTIQLEGVALNGFRGVYADSAIHIYDPTGPLRMIFVHPLSIFTGDSLRVIGTVAMQNGQVVLSGVLPQVLATGIQVPAPRVVTAAVANSADNGNLDAALVKVTGAVIKADTLDPVTGNFAMLVDDGSGSLNVVVDRSLGLATSRYTVGATLDITGLLVPAPGGAIWMLKPRAGGDLTVR